MITLPTAPKATINIDGVKDDAYGDGYWENQIRDGNEGATGKVYSAWDDKNLYFLMDVTDTTPNHEATNNYERDCVEFFINWNSTPDEDTSDTTHPYWQIRIASAPATESPTDLEPNGEQISCGGNFDSANLSQIPFKVVPRVDGDTGLTKGYTIEVAFPIALAAGATPLKDGGSVVVDFQIGDNQDGSSRGSQAFLVPDDDLVDNQWQYPNADRGILPLGPARTLTNLAASATYPASSVSQGVAAPANGSLLTGLIIGTQVGWDGSPAGGNLDTGNLAAYDGDLTTFYDPPTGQSPVSFVGLKLDKPYVLTEVRICPRGDMLARYQGASIWGTNSDIFDTDTATQIWVSDAAADDQSFQCITSDQFIAGTNTGYTHYIYFNGDTTQYGDVAELELYGTAK